MAEERTKLKCFRIEHGLKQSEMAERLGLSRIAYGCIERGERDTFSKTWEKLQDIFNIPDAEMWGIIKKYGR